MTDFDPRSQSPRSFRNAPPIGEPILPPESSSGPVPSHLHDGPANRAMGAPMESSQAIVVFLLGLFGLISFPPLGPFAWYFGKQEIEAIDAGRRPGDRRGLAQAGKIMGMVASLLMILLFVVLILASVLLIAV